jgi:Tol biopolymer transport system component
MSTLYRLRFLDLSITWWVILALNGLAAGCGGDGPTELPDASRDRIVFSSRQAGPFDIYVMDQDGGNRVLLSGTDAHDRQPAPSPDGSRIAFVSSEHGPLNIYVMNTDGTGVTQLTSVPVTFINDALNPSWSPDGAKLLFTAYTGETADVFVMNPDGTGQVNLTNDARQDEEGAWSPNGQQIAFVRWDGSPARPRIHVMDADGGNVRQLTIGADISDFSPAWSPDSRQIVFSRTEGGAGSGIYAMSASGTGLHLLTDHQGADGFPSFSRDGKLLLFHSTRGTTGGDDIWVTQPDGSEGVNLTQTPDVFDGDPRWLPVP